MDDDYQLVHIDEDKLTDEQQDAIGNWTLLEKKLINKYEKATDENAKFELLRQSKLAENQELATKIASWNFDKVNERQHQFAKLVTTIW